MKRITVGITAHVDSGKTTLAEAMVTLTMSAFHVSGLMKALTTKLHMKR